MLRQFGWGLLVICCIGLTGCGSSSSTIRVSGSSTVLPVLVKASEAYMAQNPEVKIYVNGGGSGVGISSVATKIAEIGMISRPISAAEQQKYGDDFTITLIGRDAVAAVVSKPVFDSGVTQLSRQQIQDIYTGKIVNWSAVGGFDQPILCIDKEHHRGTRQVFMSYIFGNPQIKADGADLVAGSNNEERAKILQSPAAIGMLSFAWVSETVKAIQISDGDTAVLPTPASVKNGQYPIARDLSLISQSTDTAVLAFIEFLKSDAGQKFVVQSGYIPI